MIKREKKFLNNFIREAKKKGTSNAFKQFFPPRKENQIDIVACDELAVVDSDESSDDKYGLKDIDDDDPLEA